MKPDLQRILSVTLTSLALLVSAGCNRDQPPAPKAPPPAPPPVEKPAPVHDQLSYANVDDFVTQHLSLNLHVDFEHKVLSGDAVLTIQRRNPTAKDLYLDTRDLKIRNVEVAAPNGDFQAVTARLAPADPVLGSRLTVPMPEYATRVRITYQTSPRASGLQWLSAEQTADKKAPFLFTQSEAIHARSWIPLQDTPMVRMTYDAVVTVPRNLMAVMSAENVPHAAVDGAYTFIMPQPVPSYLLALAVGNIRFHGLDRRSGIYAEPGVLDKAAQEFSDIPKMLQTAESLYGPYRWDRYDLIVLPPSFPYGGMENPRLTFATPTVLAGDKSLVSLVAHEMAHSWSGNLVTNATWNDFWLNEGFTTYFTNRIMEAVYGPARADMERVIGLQDLREAMKTTPEQYRMLRVKLAGTDPDEFSGTIPYERGSLFLYNLEKAFGRETFDAYLKGWFDRHAFTSATTDEFEQDLQTHLLAEHPGVFSKAKVDAWLDDPEIPADAVLPTSTEFARVDAERKAFLDGSKKADQLDTSDWSILHWTWFLDDMPESVTRDQLAALDAQFHLSDTGNQVLAASWFAQTIDHGYTAARPQLEKLLMTVGRMKLIVPLYTKLAQTPDGRVFAEKVFAKARPMYHPIAQAAVFRALQSTPTSRKP